MRIPGHGILLLAAIAACLTGCGSEETTRPAGEPYLPRTTPENVIENLIRATERRDFSAYRDQLDPRFEFHYRPGDVGGEGMPAAHDLAAELCLAKVMFLDARVDTIWVRMTYPAATAVTDSTAPRRAVRQVDVPVADVGLSGPWPFSDDTVLYVNLGTPQRFLFSADTLGPAQVHFSVLRHIELDDPERGPRPGGRFIPPASWGWLKHNMLLVSGQPGGPCSK